MEALPTGIVNRALALLYAASGSLALLSPLLLGERGNNAAVYGAGLVAFCLGVGAWFVPWERWPPRRNLVLFPPAFVLLAWENHHAGYDPYTYSTFFMVLFIAVGLSQPRWTSLVMVPPGLAAYLIPLVLAGESEAFAGALFDFPVFVLASETIAWALEKVGHAQRDRSRTDDRFRALAEYVWDLTVIVDEHDIITYASPASERILGVASRDLVGEHALELVHSDDLPRAHETLSRAIELPGQMLPTEVRLRRSDGSWRWVEVRTRDLRHHDAVNGFVLNISDIHERKETNARLAFQAKHDQLTGVYNLRAALEELHDRVRTYPGQLSLLFLDLDGFKQVNDRHGHAAGDELLRAVTKRLRANVRNDDVLARIGGDEFVIAVSDTDRTLAGPLAERLVAHLSEPFVLDGQQVTVGASIGVTHHKAGMDVEELLRQADTSMYEVKRRGGRAWLDDSRRAPAGAPAG